MLERKIAADIRKHLEKKGAPILIVEGARQVGKTFIIEQVGRSMFRNFIEVNLDEDSRRDRLFTEVTAVDDFYLRLSSVAGDKMGDSDDTLVFLDEIQICPGILSMLKYLRKDGRFTYIASGSLLGVTLRNSSFNPMGSIETIRMYPLDFEEFLMANGYGKEALEDLRRRAAAEESPDEAVHRRTMGLFRRYLLVGGLPAAVSAYLEGSNIMEIRKIQREILIGYGDDAARYDQEKKLHILQVYRTIPTNMGRVKKRVVASDILGKPARYDSFLDEFDYLISSGVAIEVKAITTPAYPLREAVGKNLLKLYMNDVGLLTSVLYGNVVAPVLDDSASVNLGSLYETAVACELAAHGFELYYYDNRKNGEVDFLVDDSVGCSTLPIEVKSGKDYTVHRAINKFLANPDYGVSRGIVYSNDGSVRMKDGVLYEPIYYVAFLEKPKGDERPLKDIRRLAHSERGHSEIRPAPSLPHGRHPG